jgi:hypothetical protein
VLLGPLKLLARHQRLPPEEGDSAGAPVLAGHVYACLPSFDQVLVVRGAHEQNRTADRLLTMQVLYRLSYVGSRKPFARVLALRKRGLSGLERETGFEPATLSLEG